MSVPTHARDTDSHAHAGGSHCDAFKYKQKGPKCRDAQISQKAGFQGLKLLREPLEKEKSTIQIVLTAVKRSGRCNCVWCIVCVCVE
jgi:hypothetical protein